jgi:hypothetical protein
MKKNYIIPYGERSTHIGEYPFASSLMVVDCVGLVVKHDRDKKPTDDDVRRHLIGWNEQRTTLIQADSLQDALKEFYDYPECKTGTKHRAWEMVDSETKPVIEYAGCEYMRLVGSSMTACARYDEPTKGGHMVCIFDGLDEPPSDCPVDAQIEKKGWRSEVVQVGGVWVKRYTKFVKQMDGQINAIRPKRVTA